MPGPHSHLTINQLQARLTDLGHAISNAVEEQHQICEELMGRAQPDQNEVDWCVVRDAVMDTADYDGIGGPKSLQASFDSNGLIVAHKPDPIPATPNN